MNSKIVSISAALLLLAVMVAVSVFPSANVGAAPMGAVLTPVANTNGSGQTPRFATFFDGTVTADTRVCAQLGGYNAADFQYKLTQTGVNTVTVKHQYSNNQADYVDGTTFMSGTPVPASTPFTNMAQHALFGRYACVLVDVTNATPVSVYVSAAAK